MNTTPRSMRLQIAIFGRTNVGKSSVLNMIAGQDVAITSSGLGLTDVNYKRNLDVVQQDRDGVTLRRWSLSRAWPIKFVAGEWDNESDENVIEQVTLTYDFFELAQ